MIKHRSTEQDSPDWPIHLYQKIVEDIIFVTQMQLYIIYSNIIIFLVIVFIRKKIHNQLLLQDIGIIILCLSVIILWLFYFIIIGNKNSIRRLRNKYELLKNFSLETDKKPSPLKYNIWYPVLGTLVILIFFNLGFPDFLAKKLPAFLNSLR